MSKIDGGGIRAERERIGLTQAHLAERAGVSRRTVTAIEAGSSVSAASIGKVVAALSRPAPLVDNAPAGVAPPTDAPAATKVIQVEGKRIRIESKRYTDLPVVSTSSAWETVTAVRGALVQFEQGQLSSAADIVEAMLADDRIYGLVSQRVDGLLGLPFELAPGVKDDDFAAEIAEQAGDLWPRIAPTEALRDLWLWGRFLGVGIAEKLYDTEAPEGWVPTIRVWHPRYVYWRWDTRSYWLNTQNGPVEVKQGDPHWIVYTPFGYYRGWARSLIRALAIPWLFRQFAYRDHGRYNEVHGLPIRGIIEPSEWADEDKQRALQEVAKLASESVVRLPQNSDGKGFDLKLIEATARTYDSFVRAFEQADKSISIVILGQNLTSDVKGGAYAAAQVHERVAAAIIRSDATTLSETLRAQVLVEWAALHYGPKADGKAPRPTWDTNPPEDKKGTADAVKTGAEALATLRATKLPIDFVATCKQLGIALVEGVEIPEPGEEEEEPDDPDEEDDDLEEEDRKERKAVRAARVDGGVIRAALTTAKLGRRDRAPLQGQAYVDELAVRGRDLGARILAGDVRALKRVLAEAKPLPDGKIDADGIKTALLAAYAEMKPDELADALGRCRLLAELSGRYAVTKEVVAK